MKRDIIRSTVLVQNPKNWIGIIGIDVGTQKPDLDDVRKRYPEFTFVVREKKELVIHKLTELVSKKNNGSLSSNGVHYHHCRHYCYYYNHYYYCHPTS